MWSGVGFFILGSLRKQIELCCLVFFLFVKSARMPSEWWAVSLPVGTTITLPLSIVIPILERFSKHNYSTLEYIAPREDWIIFIIWFLWVQP